MSENLKINAQNLVCNGVNTSDIIADRDYWKREAIKNAAELGEIKIKQTPMKPKKEEAVFRYIDTYTCPACNKSFSGALVNYCYRCGQAIDWSV